MTRIAHKAGSLLYLLICIAFTACFAWLFVAGANWGTILESAKSFNILYLLPALLALVAGYVFRIYRWAYLLREHAPAIHVSACITPYLSAFAINNVLPFRIGDIARITLFKRSLGANSAAITSTLVLERVLDFLSLAILLASSSFLLIPDPSNQPFFVYIFSVTATVSIALFGLLFFSKQIRRLTDIAHAYCQQWPALKHITGFIRNTVHNTYRYAHWRNIATLMAQSIGIWFAEALLFWAIARGFNITLSSLDSFLVMSLSTFSTLLPSTPGYIGTFHYLCRLAMELIGENANAAIGFAIIVHLVIVLPVTVLGGLSFMRYFGSNARSALGSSITRTLDR